MINVYMNTFCTKIVGTGHYLPDKNLTNKELSKSISQSPEWIKKRTGIHERRIVQQNQTTTELAIKAAQSALKNANIKPDEIDLLIVATSTPDTLIPSTACRVLSLLEINAPAFDIHASCSGFLYALSNACAYINSKLAKKALVIATEIRSRYVNYRDPDTSVLYGDGSGAVIVSANNDNQNGILNISLGANGKGLEVVSLPGKGNLHDLLKKNEDYPIQIAHKTLLVKSAIQKITHLIETTLKEYEISLSEIKMIIPHQMNKRILESIGQKLKIPTGKFFINLESYGNTSSASIPIALDEAVKSGKITSGDLILLVSFGAGFTWGISLIKW